MKRDNERPNSAIWLLGDSPPANQKHRLDEPLDWRFPTRHNIWTPIETVMNREMFVHNKRRIDDRKFYIRNAVKSAEIWKRGDRLHEEVLEFGKLVERHRAIPDFDSWAECLRIGTSFKRRRTEAFFSLACAGDTKPVQRGADAVQEDEVNTTGTSIMHFAKPQTFLPTGSRISDWAVLSMQPCS